MKHSFYAFAAAVVMLLPSCTLDEDISVSEPEKYTLTVNVGAPATKVVGQVASDMMLKNFQILVFTDKGNFETSTLLCSNVTQIDLKVLPGAKKVWTVANIPGRIADPENETAFLNQLTQLRFNTTEKMTMSKFESVTINADTELNIALEHIASKVVVDKITRQFNNAGYASIPLTVKRIYLSNVAGDTNFACTKNPTEWFNKMGVIDTSAGSQILDLIVDDGINYPLAQNSSYNTTHTFYAYPNPHSTDNFGTSWVARHTRLVIECDYNGRTCYYPITLPQKKGTDPGTLERNKVYHISELVLKRPGSTSPDNPDTEVESKVSVTFKITVADWAGNTSYTETFE